MLQKIKEITKTYLLMCGMALIASIVIAIASSMGVPHHVLGTMFFVSCIVILVIMAILHLWKEIEQKLK